MGLDKFDQNGSDSKGSQREYEEISSREFFEFLQDLPYKFDWIEDVPTKEMVYESSAPFPDNSSIHLRVYSTIDKRSAKSRKKGADAIRTVIYDYHLKRPIGGRTKTLRIKTWRKNLREKIESIVEDTESYVNRCPECGNWMVKKSGQYGDFLGCSNYPNCDHTEQIDD